uniref:Secretory protein n=1 Tax=Leersia perrieri TaxID=77586 RepID=A0A0D9XKY4_9ORYZ
MKLHMSAAAAAALVAVVVFAASTAGAVTFDATNTASGTAGGQRFDREVGVDYAKQVLADASAFIWDAFDQPTDGDRKPVDAVTLAVEDIGGVAFTSGDGIHLSAQYVGAYSGDVKAEVTGVLYHEATHVWQWDGRGGANGGLIEGIADFVRLRAGYAPSHWVGPGQGDRWDQGYDVTARFLDYLDSDVVNGFVAQLNAKMKDGYSDDFFVQISGGKTVDQLWQDYKAKYGG